MYIVTIETEIYSAFLQYVYIMHVRSKFTLRPLVGN